MVVVGSGPAGVAAALGLRGLNVLMLDVGHRPPAQRLPDGGGAALQEWVLGPAMEALAPTATPTALKFKYAGMRFLTELPAGITAPLVQTQAHAQAADFTALTSYAQGGLANAWGAALLRYTEADLQGFPLDVADLAPYYDALTQHIGISGSRDDALTPLLGTPAGLQPPLRLAPVGHDLWSGYRRHAAWFAAQHLRLGHARLGVLSAPLGDRAPYAYNGLEFFAAAQPGVYTPGHTLATLRGEGLLTYRDGCRVLSYSETESGVQVHLQCLRSQTQTRVQARKLVLAAGTLNTTHIVLAAHHDCHTRLPLLDNPVTLVPLLNLRRLGQTFAAGIYHGAQLLMHYYGPEHAEPVWASFYGLGGPLRSDVLAELPFGVRRNLAAARALLPAMAMAQVFYPHRGRLAVHRGPDDRLHVETAVPALGTVHQVLLRTLRRLGYAGAARLCRTLRPGSSAHYAGTLPMHMHPRAPYQTDPQGRLWGHRHVRIADGATFSRLPAKHLSFTLMANAMRIGAHLRRELRQ